MPCHSSSSYHVKSLSLALAHLALVESETRFCLVSGLINNDTMVELKRQVSDHIVGPPWTS